MNPRDKARSQTRGKVAEVSVSVNGAKVSKEIENNLVEVTAELSLDAPSLFTLRLLTWNDEAMTTVDDSIFSLGGEVELAFGYVEDGALGKVLKAEITGLELDLEERESPVLVVQGYDRLHRLLRGRKTRTFGKQATDEQIVSKIARDHGLTAKVPTSDVTYDYVIQNNQTDFAFLRQRAAAIGYELAIDDKDLHFRPRQHAGASILTLSAGEDLLRFSPRMTAVTQISKVEVRGWDPREKKAIIGQAPGTKADVVMGAESGRKAAEVFGSKSTLVVANRELTTQAEADKIAAGLLQQLSLGFIKGEGAAFGDARIAAGKVITVESLGKRFSGEYYVVSATHVYTPTRGYETKFTVKRNATS